jgi:hypothetical protein
MARDTQASKLAERTLRDREQYWRQLEPVFGATHVDGLASEHMLRYFDARTSKVSAKKEIKFLSVLCNWAKLRGWKRSLNPVDSGRAAGNDQPAEGFAAGPRSTA